MKKNIIDFRYTLRFCALVLLGILISVYANAQSQSIGSNFVPSGGVTAIYGQHDFQNGSGSLSAGIIGTARTGTATPVYGVFGWVNQASWINASNNAYVDGYARTYLSGAFTFPIGDNGVYRPAAVSASSVSDPTDAAYYGVSGTTAVTSSLSGGNEPVLPSGGPFNTASKATSVKSVDNVEYWDINGTTSAKITLTWNSTSDVASLTTSDLTKLRILGWDGTQWVIVPSTYDATSLLGGSSTLSAGSITTTSALVPNTYNVYTLGSCNITPPTLVSASPAVICSGVSSTLSGTCATGSLIWYSNAGLTTTVTSPVSPTATSTYYAVCKDADCISTAVDTTVTVNPLPTATASNTCTGSVITLTGASAGTGATYSWSGPNSFSSTSQNPTAFPNTNTNLSGIYTLTVTLNGCTAQSTTTVNCDAMPLPVKLISFTGKETNEGVLLNWKTSEEKNSDYFEIQRSIDAINFNVIGRVNSFGTSNEVKSYEFMDKNVFGNILYYRLKSVDLDASYDISKIISVIRNSNANSLVFPNPTIGNHLTVKGIDPEVKGIHLLDNQGRELTLKYEQKSLEINVELPNNIATGVYILKIFTEKGVVTKNIIVNSK